MSESPVQLVGWVLGALIALAMIPSQAAVAAKGKQRFQPLYHNLNHFLRMRRSPLFTLSNPYGGGPPSLPGSSPYSPQQIPPPYSAVAVPTPPKAYVPSLYIDPPNSPPSPPGYAPPPDYEPPTAIESPMQAMYPNPEIPYVVPGTGYEDGEEYTPPSNYSAPANNTPVTNNTAPPGNSGDNSTAPPENSGNNSTAPPENSGNNSTAPPEDSGNNSTAPPSSNSTCNCSNTSYNNSSPQTNSTSEEYTGSTYMEDRAHLSPPAEMPPPYSPPYSPPPYAEPSKSGADHTPPCSTAYQAPVMEPDYGAVPPPYPPY